MSALRVVVVGSLNMDLIVRVRQLPRPGETVLGDTLSQAAGGKGANQAVAAARLGAAVTLVGRVGRDAFGQTLKSGLRQAGVSTRWVLGSDRATGAALIEVDDQGENTIAVASGANADLLPDGIPRRVIETAQVVSAVLEVPIAAIEHAFRLARHAGARTLLNAAPAQALPEVLLGLADVIVCNELELAVLVGRDVPTGHEVEAARQLCGAHDRIVVVTLGERGALAVQRDQLVQQPAFRVEVVDTTGAGDAFIGGFLNGRWWADGLASAVRLGCAAGSLAATQRGAQPSMPTRAATDRLLSQAAD